VIDGWVRARVLETDGMKATLGVFLEGTWHRVYARTEVMLEKGAWIEGHLTVRPEEALVLFKLDPSGREAETADTLEPPPQTEAGIDLEA
jgi:hypothetical protein